MAKRQTDEGENRTSNKCPCVENQLEIRQVLVSGYIFLPSSEERDNGGQHVTVC